MGFSIEGYFIGFEAREFANDNGTKSVKRSVNVAIGSLAYRVYLSDNQDPGVFADMRPGEEVALSVRIYVSKNGKLQLVDGVVI